MVDYDQLISDARSKKFDKLLNKEDEAWDCFYDDVNGHAHYERVNGAYAKVGLCHNSYRCPLYPVTSHWKQKHNRGSADE